MSFIDTHAHLDGEEFLADIDDVVARAKQAGCSAILIPSINEQSVSTVLNMCSRFAGYAFPMIGLHPEDVGADWKDVLSRMHSVIVESRSFVAIGEVGLDFYWSREFEREQLGAFEQQVMWAEEFSLPLMIHCRKAQNELVKILRRHEHHMTGGVFHCFTGNEHEAEELLSFPNFMLGIGGVLTFKKSHLPEVLPAKVPLERIVLETDSPYMAPVPMRGRRNESAYIVHIIKKLAECYGVSEEAIEQQTNANARKIFGRSIIKET